MDVQLFRDAIETALRTRGWSLSQLGREAGIQPSIISRWLNTPKGSALSRPSPRNLEKLAPVLGISYEDLMKMCGYLHGEPQTPVGALRHVVRDQLDRWLEAVGEENESYFWADLKAKGDSTVHLIRQLRTAVSTGPEVPVSDASAERAKRGRQPRQGRNGPLGRSQHPARELLNGPHIEHNVLLVA